MKKIGLILLALLIATMFLQTMTVEAKGLIEISGTLLNDRINFKLDGKVAVPVGDDGIPVLPISYNGTTYLPVRAIGYLLGLGIDYEGDTRTVLITSKSEKASPIPKETNKSGNLIGIKGAFLNEDLKFKLDGKITVPVGDDGTPVLPISYKGTTYLPVRAIGYLLGLGIDYEPASSTVLITRSGENSDYKGPGWYFTGIEVQGKDHVSDPLPLMGTSSYMYDEYKSVGGKNDLTITHNRYNYEDKKLLVGKEYRVVWQDPPEYIALGSQASMDIERITVATYNGWKAATVSINWNQAYTVYFVGADGTKYIQDDMKLRMTMEKQAEKARPGSLSRVQVILGEGYLYEYNYEWKD